MFAKKDGLFFDLSNHFGKFFTNFGCFKNNKEKKKDMCTHYDNLSNLSNTDQLTGLFNRHAFFNDIEQKISSFNASNKKFPLFIMFIDLDGFKTINDELGHTAGDKVLKEYSDRLLNHECTKKSRIYRMGGDEFVIIFEQDKKSRFPMRVMDIMNMSSEILHITDKPFKMKDEQRRLSQSIGVATYTEGSPEDLLTFADTAMYEAKRLGKNRCVYYSTELHKKVKNRNEIIRLLKSAVQENEFHLVFQPKMIKTSKGYKKKGAEVLIRWKSKELGFVSPQIFIPIAEEAGLMHIIDKWLIEESALRIKEMKKFGIKPLFSINISAKQFSNTYLPEMFHKTLQMHDIDPSSIIIEITESATIKEPELAKSILKSFRDYGFGISVDDFGTGYSSISYLRQFPITEIKFDKSFTKNIKIDEQDEIIISGLSSIAQQLHLDIVMEGVETEQQISWIEENIPGAIIQGYYFSKPLKMQEFISFSQNLKSQQEQDDLVDEDFNYEI